MFFSFYDVSIHNAQRSMSLFDTTEQPSTILSLRDLEKPLHHILGIISNTIMIELIRDVLFGAFDLGCCHLSKAKFNIPKPPIQHNFFQKKKHKNKHVIKIPKKTIQNSQLPKKKREDGGKLTSQQIL